jgi:hypothetical protein
MNGEDSRGRAISVVIRYDVCLAPTGVAKMSTIQAKELSHGDCRDGKVSL